MRRSNSSPTSDRLQLGDDSGSASLEFITAGVMLLVPVVYLVLVLSSLQAAAFASEGAARQAARVYVTAPDEAEATQRAHRAVEFALDDFNIDQGTAAVDIACAPSTAACLVPDSLVTVSVRVDVPLPLVPAFVSYAVPVSVPITADAVQRVSTFAVLE